MKKQILFVDDEPKVLRGLQRMLCNLEDEWEMAFAESGQEALDLLAEHPFDVVVSDMRMPVMDGAQLLNEVMRRHPQIVRIVLSGHSERELVLRSVGATHQYLAKPCDPERLHSVVAQACALRELLADESFRSLVSQMNTIPSLPQLYLDIMQELEDPDGSIKKVGRIIARDVGMTAKVLQIVNSAFFGLPRHVSDPSHAASLLGLDTLKALILTAHVFSHLDKADAKGLCFDTLWNHSIATGSLAKRIASAENCETQVCDHALMAGLLHDTGKLVLAANLPDRYHEVLSLSEKGTMTSLDAERQVFGTTHAEVGAYLFGLWGLPEPIMEAVLFHHSPDRCMATTFTPLTAVHVANVIEHERDDAGKQHETPQLATEYLARLGLLERVSAWQELCLASVGEGATS